MTRHMAPRHGKRASRHWRTWAGTLIAALMPLSAVAADHAAPKLSVSPSDPFAAYEARLNDAASRVLDNVNVVQPKPGPATAQSFRHAQKTQRPAMSRPKQDRWLRVEWLRPIIEPLLRQEGLPVELAAIVLVESGGRPQALSPKGARGLWQFMPETARRYGLVVNAERDERLDIKRSTRAAARYLHDLYGQFGDWRLVFAAYNAGEDLIQRAIDRSGARDFSRLSSGRLIPLETREYVPAVVAATKMFSRPDDSPVPIRSGASRTVYADAHPDNTKREEAGPASFLIH
jgi:hypothetical protein